MLIKKYFLVLGFFFISGIAALYGVAPDWLARTFFGIAQLDINFAAFVPEQQNSALLTMSILASSLLIGRLLSFLADGKPSLLLQSYAAIEFLLIPIAYRIYRPAFLPLGYARLAEPVFAPPGAMNFRRLRGLPELRIFHVAETPCMRWLLPKTGFLCVDHDGFSDGRTISLDGELLNSGVPLSGSELLPNSSTKSDEIYNTARHTCRVRDFPATGG